MSTITPALRIGRPALHLCFSQISANVRDYTYSDAMKRFIPTPQAVSSVLAVFKSYH
jgi:hypothetical protein